VGVYEVSHLIVQARRLARDYYQSTGKSLPGISAELARHDAASQLDLKLTEDPNCGYDAVTLTQPEQHLQIRGRVIRCRSFAVSDNWSGAVKPVGLMAPSGNRPVAVPIV